MLAYATRYMPLVTEICIRNFKFEKSPRLLFLIGTLDQPLMLRTSKNGDFSNAAPPARSLAQTGERPKAMP